jgi:hypothetical protein
MALLKSRTAFSSTAGNFKNCNASNVYPGTALQTNAIERKHREEKRPQSNQRYFTSTVLEAAVPPELPVMHVNLYLQSVNRFSISFINLHNVVSTAVMKRS